MNDLNPDAWQVEVIAASTGLSAGEVRDTIAKLTDTRPESTQPPKRNPSRPAPVSGPTRCRNCNREYRGTCRKCRPQHNIKTR